MLQAVPKGAAFLLQRIYRQYAVFFLLFKSIRIVYNAIILFAYSRFPIAAKGEILR